ncbi:MAG: hypothetical protein M0R68_04025 [Bacteroidetes bacterium]|nr:hypothetical protein [Bacteroidota bacterium]
MAFGLEQFKRLKESVANTDGDNAPAEIWSIIHEFIMDFTLSGDELDAVLICNGTMDFYARLYCICAHIWNFDEQGDPPADSKEYALRILDEAIVDLTM